jgi:hydroxymethylglutaryl-CoA lyase
MNVKIYEVSMRDGLQNEKNFVPTMSKLGMIDNLITRGIKDIEVTSFVHPKWVPQLSDAEDLIDLLPEEDVDYWALVPNERGYSRALKSGVKNISMVISASKLHNYKNLNRTIEDKLIELEKIFSMAKKDNVKTRCYISTSFGCPYEGIIPERRVIDIAKFISAFDIEHIALGDTIGAAVPSQVESLILKIKEADIGLDRIALHMHDTGRRALANIKIAYDLGVRTFDASWGGLGGCPYAEGAPGNVATEDVVKMFDSMGVNTGINIG